MEKIAKAFEEVVRLLESKGLETREKVVVSQTMLSAYQTVQSQDQAGEVFKKLMDKVQKSSTTIPDISDISGLKH